MIILSTVLTYYTSIIQITMLTYLLIYFQNLKYYNYILKNITLSKYFVN